MQENVLSLDLCFHRRLFTAKTSRTSSVHRYFYALLTITFSFSVNYDTNVYVAYPFFLAFFLSFFPLSIARANRVWYSSGSHEISSLVTWPCKRHTWLTTVTHKLLASLFFFLLSSLLLTAIASCIHSWNVQLMSHTHLTIAREECNSLYDSRLLACLSRAHGTWLSGHLSIMRVTNFTEWYI